MSGDASFRGKKEPSSFPSDTWLRVRRLDIDTHSIRIPYLSIFDFLFQNKMYGLFSDTANNADLQQQERPSHSSRPSRDKFLALPKYLKLTLFIEEDIFTKIRNTEITQRFLSLEEFRERGNACLYKKQFNEALIYYIQAYSLLRWLEYKDPNDKQTKESPGDSTKDFSDGSSDEGASQDGEQNPSENFDIISKKSKSKIDELMSQVKIDLQSSNMKEMKEMLQARQKKNETKKDDADGFNDPKLKKYTAVFDDENTKVAHDGKIEDKADMDMSKPKKIGD